MKSFKYSAVDSDGIPQTGELRALSKQQAINTLKARNYIVTKLTEQKTSSVNEWLSQLKGVPRKDIIVFTRQLGTMIGSGLPISQALRLLANQANNPYFGQVITDIIQQIDGGASLYDSLSAHPKVFSRLYMSLIKAGEESGNLETILERLANTLEASQQFRSKVIGAMIYPVVIILVMVGVVMIMFLFVIPQLAALYDDMGAELPFVTKIMITASDLMTSYWWMAIIVCIGIFYGLKRLFAIPKFGRKLAKVMLKLPVFGALGMEVQMTSFTRTLGMLVSSGIPLLQAMDISRETLSNMIFREAVSEASVMVEKGKPLADAFRKYEEFPALLSEMLSVGEQTGKVDEVLKKISQYFEQQAMQKTDNLASAIEPIVLVLLGVGVGIMVVSLIMPIYSLTSQF